MSALAVQSTKPCVSGMSRAIHFPKPISYLKSLPVQTSNDLNRRGDAPDAEAELFAMMRHSLLSFPTKPPFLKPRGSSEAIGPDCRRALDSFTQPFVPVDLARLPDAASL